LFNTSRSKKVNKTKEFTMQLFNVASLLKVFLLSLTLTLIGCGGGGSSGGGETGDGPTTFSGSTAPADINADNAQEIGEAAGESVDKASASTGLPSAPIGVRVSGPVKIDALNDIILETGQQLSMPTGAEVEGVCSSGSASTSGASTSRIEVNYNDCVVSGSVTIDGSAVIEFNDANDPNAGFTITYNDFTVTDPESGTQTINAVVVCSGGGGGCTINSDFVGEDGVTHRVSDASITGDEISGYNGTATFFHGTHGSVSITVSNVTYGSCGSLPDGGTISFDGGNGTSGTINFNGDCSVTGTFSDGSGSVSF
jgi:hypothetical protein